MKERILVIDDSEIVLVMAREALEAGGFKVQTALGAREADEYIFSSQRPALILLDVMMPVVDGERKAKMLKENERTKDIPILLISSKLDEELRYLVKETGVEGYIRKPFANEYLVATVVDALKKQAV